MVKAFLGMGLLGSNFVRAMLEQGNNVQVWNRTTSKAKALEQFGTKAFLQAADAVQGADLIHITLKDDATVDAVLDEAGPGLKPGAIIIDHTTTSAKGALHRTERWKQRGFSFQHAPVFMGPQNARESTGYMLVSGDQNLIAHLEPHLSKMTGKLLNFGPQAGKAAGLKLVGNSFLLSLTAGLSDALALAKAHEVGVQDVLHLFENWNPGTTVPARLQKMMERNFDTPSWELNMARKDAGLMLHAAEETKTNIVTIPAIAALMDHWIERGYGSKDWSVIANDNV
jgi:3-hydroxyisobutyrate dehydrogenase